MAKFCHFPATFLRLDSSVLHNILHNNEDVHLTLMELNIVEF
jgi:hypothetical protein